MTKGEEFLREARRAGYYMARAPGPGAVIRSSNC